MGSDVKEVMELKRAPQELFGQILEYVPMATFDLLVEYQEGIILVKRKIAPYKNTWALPGLRMCKPEGIDHTLVRIGRDEVGLRLDLKSKEIIGQYVGRFTTEHGRQDISTGYVVSAFARQEIMLNKSHFSGFQIIRSWDDVPVKTGAMYKYYMKKYFGKEC